MKSLTEIDLIEKGAPKDGQKEEIKDRLAEKEPNYRRSIQKKSLMVGGLVVLIALGSMCLFHKRVFLKEKAVVSYPTGQIERREKPLMPHADPVSSGREKSSDNRYIEMTIIFEENEKGVPIPKMGDIILSGIDEKNQEMPPTWKTFVQGETCRAN